MSAALIYVITLNWNRPEVTLAFLDSCVGLTYQPHRLLVVDNASTDDSTEQLRRRYPVVELLVNESNLGFSAGINRGMRYALAQGADYVFIANNDTILAPDVLDRLVSVAGERGVNLAAPYIHYDSAPDGVWSLGGWLHPLTLEVARAAPKSESPYTVGFVTACCLLIHRSCLELIGEFDERFFMYYEDMDYCLRAQRAGQQVLVVPGAQVWHIGAVTIGGNDSPGERYHMALSSVLFFRKHIRGWRWLIVAPYRLASALKTSYRLLAKRRFAALSAYWRGLWRGVRT